MRVAKGVLPNVVPYGTVMRQRGERKRWPPTTLAELDPETRKLVLAMRGVDPPPEPKIDVAVATLRVVYNDREVAIAIFGKVGIPPLVLDHPLTLPESVLRRPGQWAAVLNVHVAMNGAAEATLTKPTGDDSLDRAIAALPAARAAGAPPFTIATRRG